MAKSKSKYVYFFGGGKAEGMAFAKTEKERKQILGGKGSGLADMTAAGLPVPPGFTITSGACAEFYTSGKKWPEGLAEQVEANIPKLEKATGKTFGNGANPLLVSVRSGAAASMPGMMDTVLNLGLNDETLAGADRPDRQRALRLGRLSPLHADVRRRGAGPGAPRLRARPPGVKDKPRRQARHRPERRGPQGSRATSTRRSTTSGGKAFPQDAREQLDAAINAVFGSWNNPRAIKYRQLNDIRGLLGTAVNVQTMVFGNMGDDSGTGVASPATPPPARTSSTAST